MSTNSLIGVVHGDNFKMIYCHYDGYLSGVGAMLHHHYDSPKANHLVALGDLSVLAKNIVPATGSTHCFDIPDSDVCVFYGRDRNDADSKFETVCGETEFNSYLEDFPFTYVMFNEQWYYIPQGKTFAAKRLLSTDLAQQLEVAQ